MPTAIEWCKNADGTQGSTWNPVTGCMPDFPCWERCYARRMANRLRERYGYPKDDPFRPTFHEDKLLKPLWWNKSTTVFPVSMGDLFADGVKDEWIDAVFAVMTLCRKHTFVVLTKRVQRLGEYINAVAKDTEGLFGDSGIGNNINGMRRIMLWEMSEKPGGNDKWRWIEDQVEHEPDGYPVVTAPGYWEWLGTENEMRTIETWPLPNLVIGTSASNQAEWDERVPLLCQIPAWKRTVSVEPMLGPIDMGHSLPTRLPSGNLIFSNRLGFRPFIHGILCGGESGPGARPMHPDWVRSLRDQCKDAGVAFHFKSWGEWKQTDKDHGYEDGYPFGSFGSQWYPWEVLSACCPCMVRVGKKRAGRLLDGREHNELAWTKETANA